MTSAAPTSPSWRAMPTSPSLALRIENFVRRLVGIVGVGVTHICIFVVRKAQGWIGDVADGEDHGVNFDVSGLVSGFGGNIIIPLDQDIFRNREPGNATARIGMDCLG